MLEESSLSGYSRNFFAKQHWTPIELDRLWTLSTEEKGLIQRKEDKFRLAYALKMRYFDIYGCFPTGSQDIPQIVNRMVAAQLSLSPIKIRKYNWVTRLAQVHNNEIRNYYGFRKTNASDWEKIKTLIKRNLWVQGLPVAFIYNEVYRFLKKEKLDPPAHDEFARKINQICTEIEGKFFEKCSACIDADAIVHLRSLIQRENNEDAPLTFIRKPVGKVAHVTITEELKKLEHLKSILYLDFFDTVPRKVIKKYHDFVAIHSPSDLLAMDPEKSKILLACFCHYKGAQILDHLVEIFIRRFHKIQTLSETKAKEDLWKWYAETDKNKLLDDMVDISLEHPDGIIKDKIYTGVGGEEKLIQSKLTRKSSKQICQEFEYKHMNSFYVHHHRKDFLAILNVLKLHSSSKKPLCNAIDAILKNEPPPLKGVLSKSVQQMVETKPMYAELAVLEVLQKELKCKNVWVQNAFKHADPEKDLPQDFQEKKKSYCRMLGVPENGQEMVHKLKEAMVQDIKTFNDDFPANLDATIKKKTGKSDKVKYTLCLTPYVKQDEPQNIQALKNEVEWLWPNNSLLDILKEADLRIGLTQELINMVDKVTLDPKALQERLLLCLFAMGTNTDFKKVCAGSAHTEADLLYVKKRFITPEGVRHILVKLANSTLAIRDKKIWGNIISMFVSDSTKIAVWDGNPMSEYHIRYRGDGVMAYWHVDKKALCISGQLRRCGESEVVSMLTGLLHHGTEAQVKQHVTDTHGQSFVAFAFTYLLGIELRPRIKGIGKIKLRKPDYNLPKAYYENIESVMGKTINWQLILKHYDQIIRYLVAFKLRTAEPEVLFKRFIVENRNDSLYKAVVELGRAVYTGCFGCKYLMIKDFRIETEEASNVIENWHSGNHFIFFGKRGVISSNDIIEQEMSILALHLLQSSLVYINTLMIQRVLKGRKWKNRLTVEDKRALTALFFLHLNQYGTYTLNMDKRLKIDGEE